jgi:hypothetical protein
MQRFLSLSGILTAALASCAVACGQEKIPAPVLAPRCTGCAPCCPATTAVSAPAKTHGAVHAANEKLVHELVAILKTTKSSDTFLVTVKALEDIGPRARAAVPTMILNAERMGLLKDITQQADDEETDGPGIIVSEAIAHIVAPRREREAARTGAPVNYPPPPVLPAPQPSCVISPLLCPTLPAPAIAPQPERTVRQ